MANSEQLEREADKTRAQLADALEELRSRLSPADILHRLLNPAEDGGAAAVARRLRDNPMPASLVGAGLAWMLMKGPGGASQSAGASQNGPAASDEAGGAGVRQTLTSAADNLRKGASEGSDRLFSFVQEEPIVLAGLGVALGAILGALLPASEAAGRPAGSGLGEQARRAVSVVQTGTGIDETPLPPPGGNGSFPDRHPGVTAS
ncbi:MAG: hypothetical protein CTY15_11465 [Methylocystis sp.]|nr:MAG: hypothetical protein CTY15_11465 [Methylocystis sp.]